MIHPAVVHAVGRRTVTHAHIGHRQKRGIAQQRYVGTRAGAQGKAGPGKEGPGNAGKSGRIGQQKSRRENEAAPPMDGERDI